MLPIFQFDFLRTVSALLLTASSFSFSLFQCRHDYLLNVYRAILKMIAVLCNFEDATLSGKCLEAEQVLCEQVCWFHWNEFSRGVKLCEMLRFFWKYYGVVIEHNHDERIQLWKSLLVEVEGGILLLIIKIWQKYGFVQIIFMLLEAAHVICGPQRMLNQFMVCI